MSSSKPFVRGLHPETSEFLRPRHSGGSIATDGEVESKARSLYGFTFSAPKSVSVQALVGGDDRLLEAHRHAVNVALQEAERYAGTRVRFDGANHNRQTGHLVIAAYTHDSSRQLNPQLHTHAVAANLSYDGVEGRWKALQASGVYYREFTHGYAVTAHRSHSKTVDHVIVSADVMKQELFYVAASRGREGILSSRQT